MPLIERLEWRGGLFLDSASTMFFGGERSSNGELPEDNSSSAAASLSPGKMGSLPLLCLIGGAGWLLPRLFHPDPLPNEPADNRSLVVDGQHGSAIQPSVWLAILVLFPYPDTSEETCP